MQVNLSANLPNSTGESAPAISKENAGIGSGSAFLAQMGQIWNQNNGNDDAQIEEASGKQIAGAAFKDSRNPLPDVSNPFAKPPETGSVPTSNSSNKQITGAAFNGSENPLLPFAKSTEADQVPTPNPSDGQIAGAAFKDSENPLLDVSNPLARLARTEPASMPNPSSPAQPIQGSMPDANALIANNAWIPNEDPNNAMASKESAGERNSQTDVLHPAQATVEASFGTADEENAIREADSTKKHVENLRVELLSIFSAFNPDGNLQASALKDADSQAALSHDSDFIVNQELRASQDSHLAQTVFWESRRVSYRPELDSIPKDLRFADNFVISRDPNAQTGSSQIAVSPGKPEDTAPAAFETNRTDDAQGVQQAFQIESARQKTPQAELWKAPPDSSLTQTRTPEFRQDLFSQSNPAPKDLTSAGDLLAIQDPNLQSRSPQVTISAKSESMVLTALDKTSTGGDSQGDQNASRNESFLGTASQNKLESVAPDSSRLRTPVGERQQELPFQSASIAARPVEPSSMQVSSPVQTMTAQPRELIQQIAERIQIQLRDGKSEIVVQLKPDSLGRLEIRAESTSSGVVARITTESGSVKGYLESNLHLLQQTLQDQGLKVDRIHIIVQDGFNSQSSPGYASQFGHTGSGHTGSEPHKSSETPGNVAANQPEEVVVDSTTWVSLNPNTRFHTVA